MLGYLGWLLAAVFAVLWFITRYRKEKETWAAVTFCAANIFEPDLREVNEKGLTTWAREVRPTDESEFAYQALTVLRRRCMESFQHPEYIAHVRDLLWNMHTTAMRSAAASGS